MLSYIVLVESFKFFYYFPLPLQVSQLNLHISLLFIVGVQMALCMLGHAGGLSVGQDPLVKVEASGGRLCGMKPLATLATRVYLLFLLLLCLLLAAFNRKIQRNHNEVRFCSFLWGE